jgi:predicted phosphodiesterase
MRIVVLSDIHSNRTALQTVLATVDALTPDAVVVAGDIINRGPQPRICLEAVLDRRDRDGWHVLKGNHEDYVLLVDRAPVTADHYAHELFAHTRWTRDRVSDLLPRVRELPDQLSLTGPDGSEVRFLHASMQGNRSGLYEDMEDEVIAALVAPAPPVTVVGHTHVPFVREVKGALVINAGAAGLPFDGDPRAALAVLDWQAGRWQARIVRIAYDGLAAERDFFDSGFMAEGGPMVPLILDELRQARPRLGLWHRDYESRVARGELTLTESVASLLKAVGARAHGWA